MAKVSSSLVNRQTKASQSGSFSICPLGIQLEKMTTRRGPNNRGHNRLNSSSAITGSDEMGNLGDRGEGGNDIETLRRDLNALERENNRVGYSIDLSSRQD